MADWQPIETAPRDGTVILLWAPSRRDDRSSPFAGCWAHGTTRDNSDLADATYPWLAFDPSTGGLSAYMEDRVKHWMPLPEAPMEDE